jgi:hypothetical protein
MRTKLALILGLALLFTGAVVAAHTQSPPAAGQTAPQNVELKYWLTIKSGVRHNSKCQYFHNSNGRPCTKDEGRACKKCGG